jgi:acyl-CoA reductase-like NAD-dependent aldehyde dehydrogenase
MVTLSSVCYPKIEAAVEAAREAFPIWSSWSPEERAQVLNRLADLLEQSLEELAQAESKDQGESVCGRLCPSSILSSETRV